VHSVVSVPEEVSDYRKDIATQLITKIIPEDNKLFVTHSTLKRQLSSTSYKITSLLVVPPMDTPTPATTDGTGVKLPKLNVHTFNGNITRWKQFWDQFTVAVHSREDHLPATHY